MRIVLIGGGSFVFAPTVVEDVLYRCDLGPSELVLVDVTPEAVELLAAAGRRLAAQLGKPLTITHSTDRKESLVGADVVIVSAAVQGALRWRMDYEVLQEANLSDQARECGGIGGLLNTFRAVTLVMDICRDMERICPQAWLLDVTNPMPRVVTAVQRYSRVKVAGFCNIAYRGERGYEWFARLLGRKMEQLNIRTAGLNHFSWLVSIQDRRSGEDLLPQVKRVVLEEGSGMIMDQEVLRELKVMKRWFEQYDGIVAGAVDHHAEYLPVQSDIHYHTVPPYHGSFAEREKRFNDLRRVAEGKLSGEHIFRHGSWEHPVLFAHSIAQQNTAVMDMLNIPNQGYLPDLPKGRIVEVPSTIGRGEVHGHLMPSFPKPLAGLMRTVSDVHELAVEAAWTGDRKIALRCIELDIAIPEVKGLEQLLARLIDQHKDLLPQFH